MTAFPDRRHLLFGRQGHLNALLNKTETSGVTAVIARAKMGKTWLLEELCRRLSEEEGVLVGYFEYKGGGSSHLLYAVGDLYTRWLSSASFSDQFKQRWEEYNKNLPSITGQVIGKIGAAIIGLGSRSMEQLVRDSFEMLSSEILKLKTGGLDLAPSDYGIAKDLVHFLNKVSQKNVCIVLDAWGKSNAMEQEYLALEGFLNHLHTWPPTHIYLGIRDPDETPRIKELAEKLDTSSRYATIFRLPPMDLKEDSEKRRLLQHLRSQAPVTKTFENEPLLRLIDAFPGVLERWIGKLVGNPPETLEDLEQLADDAQKNRYPEFNWILKDLSKEQRDVVITLALLPRLDEGTWGVVEEWVFSDDDFDHLDDLTNLGILEQAMIPSFGHDTRHQWARRWLLENYAIRCRKVGEHLIEAVAESVADFSPHSWLHLSLLHTFKDWIETLELKPLAKYCVATAVTVLDFYNLVIEPPSACWEKQSVVKDRFPFLSALWPFSRGIWNIRQKNLEAAIQDNDQAIALNPVFSTAYNNRGVAKAGLGDVDGALKDYYQATVINPEDAFAHYNLSCLYALKGNFSKMLQYLARTFELGTIKEVLNLVESDSDFKNVREEPSFQRLLEEYQNKG